MQALSIPKCVHTFVPPELLEEYIGDASTIIVPLRDPRSNWNAWARRWPVGKPWDKRIAEFERSWHGMAWFLRTHKATIIPIEKFPVSDIPRIGSEDHGENARVYKVEHLYKYNFVKEYYKP